MNVKKLDAFLRLVLSIDCVPIQAAGAGLGFCQTRSSVERGTDGGHCVPHSPKLIVPTLYSCMLYLVRA